MKVEVVSIVGIDALAQLLVEAPVKMLILKGTPSS